MTIQIVHYPDEIIFYAMVEIGRRNRDLWESLNCNIIDNDVREMFQEEFFLKVSEYLSELFKVAGPSEYRMCYILGKYYEELWDQITD